MTSGVSKPQLEHVDVLIVGAGLSGIGAGCHLQLHCPAKSFVILEARESSGGTWDLFRFPGVRSDSDMFTLSYSFRPWTGEASIADGASILQYLRDTARLNGIETKIRYRHRVVHASWSTPDSRWTVRVQRSDTRDTIELTCSFLFGNTGYYRYDQGYRPHFEGVERFTGRIVHPQHWPAELDHTGKRVVVIGSGATAITLVPSLARRAAHVSMLQRSPSYVISLPARDPFAVLAHRRLPARLARSLVRWKNILLTTLNYQLSRRAQTLAKAAIRRGVRRRLPAGYPVDTHFAPRYTPWEQRLTIASDGDLFAAIRSGRASIVTDRIRTFTEDGVLLASGELLPADVIVTATGLTLQLAGGISLDVDGRPVDLAATVGYKSMMFSGVPNFALTIGYTNASWTLKADLTAQYVCRLLTFMDRRGFRQCTPKAPDPALPVEPFLNLSSGYITRSSKILPKQGTTRPWRLPGSYPFDLLALRYGKLDDAGIDFTAATAAR